MTTLSEIVKKAMLAGLGAQEKAKEFVDDLVKAGELSKSDAASLVKEWTSKAAESTKDLDNRIRETISSVTEKINIPTRGDIESIEKKLKSINTRLKKLEGGKSGEEEGEREA